MTKARLIIKDEKGQWSGRGIKEFAELPRVGDYVEIGFAEGDDEVAYWYRVVLAVVSEERPQNPEIYAVREGVPLEVLKRVREEN